jgi:hypothetical protein
VDRAASSSSELPGFAASVLSKLAAVRRAIKASAKDPDSFLEEADYARCGRTSMFGKNAVSKPINGRKEHR